MSKNGGHSSQEGGHSNGANRVPSRALTQSHFRSLGPEMVPVPIVQSRGASPKETRRLHTAGPGRLVTDTDRSRPSALPAPPAAWKWGPATEGCVHGTGLGRSKATIPEERETRF